MAHTITYQRFEADNKKSADKTQAKGRQRYRTTTIDYIGSMVDEGGLRVSEGQRESERYTKAAKRDSKGKRKNIGEGDWKEGR